MSVRIVSVLVAVVAAAALVGCSSEGPAVPDGGNPTETATSDPIDTPGPNPDGTPNPCDLATEADLSAALGSPAGEQERASEREAEFCRIPAADRAQFAELDLMIEPGGSELFEALKAQAQQQAPAFAEIDGIGDAAFRSQADDRGAEISVLQGFYILHVSLSTPFASGGAEGRAVDLATVIIAGI